MTKTDPWQSKLTQNVRIKEYKKRFYRLPQTDFIQRIRIKKASNCLLTTLKEGNRAMPSNSEGKVLQT